MALFLAKRLGFNVAALAILLVVVSLLLRLVPADPVDVATFGAPMTPAAKAHVRESLGLTGSALDQMGRYLDGLVHGDMGMSLLSRIPVTTIILDRLGATLELALAGLLIALVIAVPLGLASAMKRDQLTDYAGSLFVLVGFAIPSFILGVLLIYLFAVKLGWLPASGREGSLVHAILTANPSEFVSALRYVALPAITLGIGLAAVSARIIRSSMLEALRNDYVRFARAKGLPRRAVTKHALRNALIPVVTVLGLQLGYLLSGVFIIENVFAWPGLGRLAVQSIGQLDYPVIQGVVLISAAIFLTINLIVDLLYAAIDPRVRLK
jgi:ABC-type dipeptide/oligopeptide/nickel transport system permease component